LDFAYDASGNMTLVYFGAQHDDDDDDAEDSNDISTTSIASLIYVYPNPTRGKITVVWDAAIDDLVVSLRLIRPEVFSAILPLTIYEVDGKRKAKAYVRGALGYYILNIQLSDGREINKKVLKI
jgi:hypothetical protein